MDGLANLYASRRRYCALIPWPEGRLGWDGLELRLELNVAGCGWPPRRHVPAFEIHFCNFEFEYLVKHTHNRKSVTGEKLFPLPHL